MNKGLARRMTAAAVLLAGAWTEAALAEDPDFLSVGAGAFDWNRRKNVAIELRAEYRSDLKLWIFKPVGGLMFTSDGAFYAFAGVGVDVFLGRRLVVTPSFAPGYYAKGGGLDLGYPVEFRSQIEFAYRFDDRSRLGLAISHMSNVSIADENPGAESAILYYSIPLPSLLGR